MANGKIVAIEDDPGVGKMLRHFFMALGYDLKVFTLGRQGIDAIQQNLPDLILLDIMLPDMDGLSVYRELRANNRTFYIPIIFLTQKDDRSDKLSALELGADDYVTKPFDIDELRLRVERAIQRTRQRNLTNPRTGLPARSLLEEHVRERISQPGWAMLTCHIDAFDHFVDQYGFMASDYALHTASQVIQQVTGELDPESFVSHTEDNEFTVVIGQGQTADIIAERLTTEFNERIKTHYTFEAREQGYMLVTGDDGKARPQPLMSMSVQITYPDQLFS